MKKLKQPSKKKPPQLNRKHKQRKPRKLLKILEKNQFLMLSIPTIFQMM